MSLLNKVLKLFIVRRRLLEFDYKIRISDLGAGSQFYKNKSVRLSQIVRYSCSNLIKSLILSLLAKIKGTRVILELGSCVGLNAIVFSLFNSKAQVISIEGDSNLYHLANRLSKIFKTENLIFINSDFDKVLYSVLNKYKPDFIFIDGNHRYEPTLAYFNMICNLIKNKAIVIIDDIFWNSEMKKAWKKIYCNRIRKKKSFVKFGIITLKREKNGKK